MIHISSPVKIFQAYQLLDDLSGQLTSGQVYKAMTDGFVNAICDPGVSGGIINGFVGSTSDPTLLIQEAGLTQGQGTVSICFPVKKDYYWKVTLTGATPTLRDLIWTPAAAGIATPEKQ